MKITLDPMPEWSRLPRELHHARNVLTKVDVIYDVIVRWPKPLFLLDELPGRRKTYTSPPEEAD